MSWLNIVWSLLASSCLVLAAMYLVVWFKYRRAWANLAFVFMALGVAGTAAGELAMMRATTPEALEATMQLTYVAVTIVTTSLIWFAFFSFGKGRAWLAWVAVGLWALALLLNFTTGTSIVYTEIIELREVQFLGETVTAVARGITNPSLRVDELANLALLIFVVDASLRLWRKRDRDSRRRAVWLGGATVGFVLLAAGFNALVDNQVIQSPYMISMPFLGILSVMAMELCRDHLKSIRLVNELLASRAELDEQLKFEQLATEISSLMIQSPASKVDQAVMTAMEQCAQALGFDGATYSVFFEGGSARISYVWCEPEVSGLPSNLTEKDFPWLARELLAGRDTLIPSLDDMPLEAAVDRATYLKYGVKSSCNVSVTMGGKVVGVFTLGSFQHERSVPAKIVQRQHIIGDLLANAIQRARSEMAVRTSEFRLNLAASAADLGLWSWNPKDNSLWATARAKEYFGFRPNTEISFQMWLERVHPDDRSMVEAKLKTTLKDRCTYEIEYRILTNKSEVRWISARGELTDEKEDLLMSGVLSDITVRKRLELESQMLKSELAHAGRVTLMGTLASSLAHELGQPLGAILRNAEAAEMILQEADLDLEELAAIVKDIREDDQRAGNVIRKLRSLLKRGTLDLQKVNLAELIADVVSLVKTEAAIRETRMTMALDSDLPQVFADRVHLQQVLLNLIINAMDASAQTPVAKRQVIIAAKSSNGLVEVSVEDNGTGIDDAAQQQLFEPFFTTKSQGMGLGLSVTKTIVEAHGGKLTAANRPSGGAEFKFTLPVRRNEDTLSHTEIPELESILR